MYDIMYYVFILGYFPHQQTIPVLYQLISACADISIFQDGCFDGCNCHIVCIISEGRQYPVLPTGSGSEILQLKVQTSCIIL